MSTTYKKQKLVTSQHDWYNVLPSYQETMNLNLYEQHFSYVNDMEKYSHSYPILKF